MNRICAAGGCAVAVLACAGGGLGQVKGGMPAARPTGVPTAPPVNPGQAVRAVCPGQAPAGVVTAGQGDVARTVSPAQTGVVDPGALDPRTVRPGQIDTRLQDVQPGYVVPARVGAEMVSPGQANGVVVNPGQLDPRMVRPGLSDGRLTSPGQVYDEVVAAGRGIPIFTVHPGLEMNPMTVAADAAPARSVNQRIGKSSVQPLGQAQVAQRLVVIQGLPAEQQGVELQRLIDDLRAVQANEAVQLSEGQLGARAFPNQASITPRTAVQRPAAGSSKGVWVTGTKLSRTPSGAAAAPGSNDPAAPQHEK